MTDESVNDDLQVGFSLCISNTRSSAHFARLRFAAYVKGCGIETTCAEDIILAVGEALANAVEHGHRPNGTLSIQARRRAHNLQFERLEIEIADDGHGFAPRPHALPDASGARGFGIHIMRTIMDTVEYHDGGRRVILMKTFRIP